MSSLLPKVEPNSVAIESSGWDSKSLTPKKEQKSILVLGSTVIFCIILIFIPSQVLVPIKRMVVNSGSFGILICISLLGILGISPIPSEPITVFITGIFGPFLAMIITWLGNLFSALLEYGIGINMREITDFEKIRQNLPFNLSALPIDSPLFLIAGRMVPGVGPKVVSLVSGIYRVPIRRYIWTTMLANIFGAFAIAFGVDRIISWGKMLIH